MKNGKKYNKMVLRNSKKKQQIAEMKILSGQVLTRTVAAMRDERENRSQHRQNRYRAKRREKKQASEQQQQRNEILFCMHEI